MYIAFKWLVGFAFCMWIAVCCFDVVVLQSPVSNGTDYKYKEYSRAGAMLRHPEEHVDSVSHYVMFAAGALVVSLFNKKREIISFAKKQMTKVDVNRLFLNLITTYTLFKVTTHEYSIATLHYVKQLWSILKRVCDASKISQVENDDINGLMLKKLEDVMKEKNRLLQLLSSANKENEAIKMQYDLELLAKDRLLKRHENTQKNVLENRRGYVNFQHLYLIVHQENLFLKSLAQKLTTEKEKAEKTLMTLVGEIFSSKSNELKAYCSRFIVRADMNLFNTDMRAEIDKFINKAKQRPCSKQGSFVNKFSETDFEDNIGVVPFVSEEPKAKEMPRNREYVWTVKDEDGLIEKLYEYNHYSVLDNGDVGRRIREYTVYHEKDCLLDKVKSRSRLEGRERTGSNMRNTNTIFLECKEPQKFLTGSELFQNFVRNNLALPPTVF